MKRSEFRALIREEIKRVMHETRAGLLRENNEAIDLSQKESEVVSLLVLNRSFFVSIETLHDRVWENCVEEAKPCDSG